MKPLVRWTIGPCSSDLGYLSLRLSVQSMKRLLGTKVDYAICYNNLSLKTINSLPSVDILVDQSEIGRAHV